MWAKLPHTVMYLLTRSGSQAFVSANVTSIQNSESVYELVYNQVLGKYGKKFNNEVRAAIWGTTEQEASRKTVEMLGLPVSPEQYWGEIEEMSKDKLSNPIIKPGAERLIRHFSEKKVPMAIATSGSEYSFRIKSKGRPDLFAHFHHIVHGSSDPEVINGKPAPDIFLVAAKRFSQPADPTKCLVFEDAPNGLRGALDAGMQVVFVPEFKWSQDLTKGADLILTSLEEFLPEQFGLPPLQKEGAVRRATDVNKSPK